MDTGCSPNLSPPPAPLLVLVVWLQPCIPTSVTAGAVAVQVGEQMAPVNERKSEMGGVEAGEEAIVRDGRQVPAITIVDGELAVPV